MYMESLNPFVSGAVTNLSLHQDPDNRTHPYRPMPDCQGRLLIDPDILLKARKFDLEINFFYASSEAVLTYSGMNRNSSLDCYIDTNMVSGQLRTVYGDFSTGNYAATTPYTPLDGCISTISYDSVADKYIEYFPNGMQMKYGTTLLYKQKVGNKVIPVYDKYRIQTATDPSGVIHTYTYVIPGVTKPPYALLQTVQVPGGRLVTSSYSTQVIGGTTQWLRSNLNDWSGRAWTFQYDATGNLTTYATPSGCTTKYSYTSPSAGTTLVYTIEDPRGYRTTYGYDVHQRVISMAAGAAIWGWTFIESKASQVMTEPNGALTTYMLDSNGQPSTTIWAAGFTTTYLYGNKLKILEYGPQGLVTSIAYDQRFWLPQTTWDPLGNATTNLYDGFGNLTTLIDALGNTTIRAFGSPSSHQITSEKNALGFLTSYTYNAAGQIVSTQDPRGFLTTNSYDSFGNLASVLASDGGVATFAYDNLSRLISRKDALGRTTTFAYDLADNLISQMNALGQVMTYIYNTCLLVAVVDAQGSRTSYAYDRLQNRVSTTDPLGNITTSIFDNKGNLIGTQNPLGYITTVVLDIAYRPVATIDPLGFRMTYSYDSAGRQNTVRDQRGYVATTVFDARDAVARVDALGNRWTTVYDALGRQSALVRPLGDATTIVYDSVGRRSAQIDALSNRTSYSYNSASSLIEVQDPLGNRSTTVYGANSNRAIAQVDAFGNRTTSGFDIAGQLVTTMNARGAITTNIYDAVGRLQSSIDALGNRVTNVFDTVGRSVARQDAFGYYTSSVYDSASRMIASVSALGYISTIQYDSANQVTTLIDSLGSSRISAYDANGRITTSKNERGFVTSYAYDVAGHTIQTVNPRGYWVSQSYDPLGRTFVKMDWYGNRTTLGYDANGRNVSIRDPRGYFTTTVFSKRDEVTALVDGLGLATSYVYDPGGRRLCRQFADGALTSYSYDALGRSTTTLYQSGLRLTYGYDASSNRTTMVDWVGTATYIYDSLNRIVGKTQFGLSQSYFYGSRGERTKMIGPDGSVRTYLYDVSLRLTTFQSDALEMTYQYDSLNRSIWVGQTGANSRAVTFDATSNTTAVISTSSGGLELERFTYIYDAGGLKMLAQDANVFITYGYDAKDRLTTEFAAGPALSWTHTIGYDAADNRTVLDGVTYVFDAANRVMSSTDGQTWQFDAKGNLTTWANNTAWTYDEENRATAEFQYSGGAYLVVASYLYDGSGKKVVEIDQAGATTTLIWDGEDYVGGQS